MFSFLKNIILLLLCCFCIVSCTETNKKSAETGNVDIMRSDKLIDTVIVKSWDILIQGQKLADNGKTINEIIKILPAETIFQTNENSILFFIEGSVPLIIDVNKIGSLGKGSSAAISNATLGPNISPSNSSNYDLRTDIVASDKNDDDRQKKKALILAPYNNTDFKNNDDANDAFDYLRENRNYWDNINFLRYNIQLDDFTSFGEYDLVHLSTHGNELCKAKLVKADFIDGKLVTTEVIQEAGCTFEIDTNINHGFKNLKNNKVQLKKIHDHYKKYRGVTYTVDKIRLSDHFFQYAYPKKLKNKIWIFSACDLGKSNKMLAVMRNLHKNGHFFYWEKYTLLTDSKKAIQKLYENMILKGMDAANAYDEIPVSLKSIKKKGKEINAFRLLQTEDNRHAIEIIELLNPETDESVRTDDEYPITGTLNDGKKDRLDLKVKLLGYTKNEFEVYKMKLSLFINGKKVLNKKSFLPNTDSSIATIQQLADHKHGIMVTIKEIEIPDVGEERKLTLKAVLHLNDENISIHKEQVSIKDKFIKLTLDGTSYLFDIIVVNSYKERGGGITYAVSGFEPTLKQGVAISFMENELNGTIEAFSVVFNSNSCYNDNKNDMTYNLSTSNSSQITGSFSGTVICNNDKSDVRKVTNGKINIKF